MLEIERPHLVRFIGDYFEKESRAAVFITGPSGIGKSTLVSQFVKSIKWPSIHLRVTALSRWTYDPRHITERLVERTASLLGEEVDLDVADELLVREHHRLVRRLARKARRDGVPILFAVDGLDAVPADNHAVVEAIAALIPFGIEEYRFLLSGIPRTVMLPSEIARSAINYSTPPFSADETSRAFKDLALTSEQIRAIDKLSRGFPETLTAIHRIISAQPTAKESIDSLSDSLTELYEKEWNLHDEPTRDEALALASLIEEPELSTNENLPRIVDSPGFSVDSLGRFSFLERQGPGYTFRSNSLAEFVHKKVAASRDDAVDSIVRFLLAAPEHDRTMDRVTRVLARHGRSRRLLTVLSDNRFSQLVHSADSLASVHATSSRGVEAALQESDPAAALQFTIQRASVSNYVSSEIGHAEITALIALGDVQGALAIAESESLVEARFRRLCVVARACKEFRSDIPGEIVTSLRQLFEKLPKAAYGNEALNVAADLVFAAPDLAASLVKDRRSTPGNENALDYSFAMLALQAATVQEESDSAPTGSSATFAEQVVSPRLRSLLTAAALSRSAQTASAVIRQVNSIEPIEEKLFVLESWMLANRERGDALDVLDFALKICVSSAAYTATARTYRRLSRCLLFHPTLQQLSYYVRLIDDQLSGLERIGPQPELHRLIIQLARAVWRIDRVEGERRLQDSYLRIAECADLLDRAAGYARLLGTLAVVDPDRTLEEPAKLHTSVRADLDLVIEDLMAQTADHVESIGPIISALSIALPSEAIALALRLNLPRRRDQALALVVAAHIRGNAARWSIEAVGRAVLGIENPVIRDQALGSLREGLQLRGVPIQSGALSALADIFELSADRGFSARNLAFLARSSENEAHRENLIGRSLTHLSVLARADDRTLATLEVIAELASVAPDRSRQLIGQLGDSRIHAHGPDATATVIIGLRLAIRASVALFKASVMQPGHTERLVHEIERVPDPAMRAALLSELVISCHIGNGSGENATQLTEVLLKGLADIPQQDVRVRTNAIAYAAPALYLTGAEAACDQLLREIGPQLRDSALERVARVIRLGVHPDEPFEEIPGRPVPMKYAQALRLLAIAEMMSSDASSFNILEQVVLAIGSPDARTSLSAAQRTAIRSRIQELSRRIYPSPSGIAHEGYLICVDALLETKLSSRSQRVGLTSLLERARALPNLADTAFVLCFLAAYATEAERSSVIEETKTLTASLPSVIDRIDRLTMLARLIAPLDSGRCRIAIREAFTLADGGVGASFDERRRWLISLAYRIDSSLGQGLAARSDDDPAKQSIEEAKRVHGLRDRFRSQDIGPVCEAPTEVLSRVAWLLVGSLNSRRLSPASEELLLLAVRRAAQLPLTAAYPLLSLAIQSEVRRAEGKARVASTTVLPLFEAALRASTVARESLTRLAGVPSALEGIEHRSLVDAPEGDPLILIAGHAGSLVADSRLTAWLERISGAPIVIADPYFDVAFIRHLTFVARHARKSKVCVLTSKGSVRTRFGENFEAAIREEWWRQTADAPQETLVVMCTFRGTTQSPIHDRWWVTSDSGLDLGSSAGGLSGRLTSLREMPPEEATRIFSTLDGFANQSRRFIEDQRVDYSTFTLD